MMSITEAEYKSAQAREQRHAEVEARTLIKEFGDPNNGDFLDPYGDIFTPIMEMQSDQRTVAENISRVRAELQQASDQARGEQPNA